MIAIIAAVRFPKDDVLYKTFHIIAFLVNNLQIDLFRIGLQGFLTFYTLGVRVDVMTVKKTHYLQAFFSHGFNRIYRAVCAAYMQKNFHALSPKMAVPIRTSVAPSSMATSKSPVMPIDNSCMDTLAGACFIMSSRNFLKAAKKGRTFSG